VLEGIAEGVPGGAPAAVDGERERLHRRLDLLLRATADGICGLDREGRITFCNAAARSILHRDEEALEGRCLHDLVHVQGDCEDHPAATCPLIRGAEDGIARRNRQDQFRRPDGSAFEAEYEMLPIRDFELAGAVVSFRDVTDRVLSERQLRRTLREVRALSAQRGRLLREVAHAQERERGRIAADIHDDTVQVMSAVALHVERIGAGVEDPALAGELADLRTVVRDAAARLRRLLFDLAPPNLQRSLADAIGGYAAGLASEAGFAVELVDEGAERLPHAQRVLVYRLAQEALINVAKHARATRVDVRLRSSPTGFLLVVEDDGVGFDPVAAQREAPRHLGLTFLRQRAESAGGQLRLRAAAGRGTRIEAWLPPPTPDEAR
jgi:PAS domain S-box-containing protein